jgi:hypothetical protein
MTLPSNDRNGVFPKSDIVFIAQDQAIALVSMQKYFIEIYSLRRKLANPSKFPNICVRRL